MTLDERAELLRDMQEHGCVSGREEDLACYLAGRFGFRRDESNNLIANRRGFGTDRKTVLIEAHLDEVGFTVAEILPGGFLRIEAVGGVSPDVLPGTELEIFSRSRYKAVIGSVPPHLTKGAPEKKTEEGLFADAGFADEKIAAGSVRIGDPIHFAAGVKRMGSDRIISRGLDNKAAVICLIETYLSVTKPFHDLVFVLSSGEETGGSGIRSFTASFKADLALVVDAGFAGAEGLDLTRCISMDQGPSVSVTDTLSLPATRWVQQEAKQACLPCQVVAEPGGTGTNATFIQTRRSGIPSAVISIPVLNMHAPNEVVSSRDISAATDLLTRLVTREKLPCREEGHCVVL